MKQGMNDFGVICAPFNTGTPPAGAIMTTSGERKGAWTAEQMCIVGSFASSLATRVEGLFDNATYISDGKYCTAMAATAGA